MRSCCSSGLGEMADGAAVEGCEKRLDVGFILKVEPGDLLTDLKGECEKVLQIEGDF